MPLIVSMSSGLLDPPSPPWKPQHGKENEREWGWGGGYGLVRDGHFADACQMMQQY